MATEPQAQPSSLVQETQFTSSDPPLDAEVRTNDATYGSVDREAASPSHRARKTTRALGPDLLRGAIIVLQALDHAAVIFGAWRHGTAIESEEDGTAVTKWNTPIAWVVRMLTHLCAPGFTFLLGMGVVYFGKSRTKLGWHRWSFFKHFFIRGAVLAIVSQVLGLIAGWGIFWVLNMVLLALAVDYFLAGVLWLILRDTESALAEILAPLLEYRTASAETSPLLDNSNASQPRRTSTRAETISFHVHNALLFCLAVVTIWWNIWLSRDGGRCSAGSKTIDDVLAVEPQIPPQNPTLFEFMFYPVVSGKVLSQFPPLAWISFAIFGLLYGRYLLRYPRPAASVATVTALAGVVFAAFFVLTRLLHIGNLSEDCLRMPENVAHPNQNQYLVSFRAFFYIIKYPPSPAYMSYTMAMNLFLLAIFTVAPTLPPSDNATMRDETWSSKILRVFYAIMLPFGQCALFFYVFHLLLFQALAKPVKAWFGHDLGFDDIFAGARAIGTGNTPVFWFLYLSGLVTMWCACRWYGRFKASKGPDSIWRFF